MIEVKPYSECLEEKHIAFASKYWTKSRRKIPKYIYWKFRRKNATAFKAFILAIDDGVVVGQLGLIPCKINIDGKLYESQWACDLMVDIEYRGKGVAKILYEYAHKIKPITLGSDPSPAAFKSMKKNGYLSIKGPFKFLFAIKIGEITKLKGYNYKFLNSIYNPFILLILIFSKLNKNKFFECNLENYIKLKQRDNSSCLKIEQNDEFVNWRFQPFEGFYPGVETYRTISGNYFSGYYSGNEYVICDFGIDNFFDIFKIISLIYMKYKEKKILKIKFFSNHVFLDKYLFFWGFVKFRTRSRTIFFTKDNSLKNEMLGKLFYYTYLDSDENI